LVRCSVAMQFNVSQLLKASPGEERKYRFDEPELRYEEVVTDVRGDVRLLRTDRGILVMGEVETAVRCECSRCLEKFVLPVAFAVEDEFLPSIDINTGFPVARAEEKSLVIDAHHVLDLGETVRQYAIMEMPMKPLCKEDCMGLCVTCGRNLNRGRCACPPAPMDIRWAKLADLNSLKK